MPEQEFADWVIAPNKRVVAAVRESVPDAKIIGFPRAATITGYEAYAAHTGRQCGQHRYGGFDALGVKKLGTAGALQGNLDPIALIAGGDALNRAVDRILGATKETLSSSIWATESCPRRRLNM